MLKKIMSKKGRSTVLISVSIVCVCVIGIIVQQSISSSRVVLKDELQIHRKLLHNAETEHACDCFSPFITNFKVSNVTATSADISWKNDAPSTYQVKYGEGNSLTTLYPTETPTVPYTQHTFTLPNLKPNTNYVVGPTSICLKRCTRNAKPNLRRTHDVNGKRKWSFKTLDQTSIEEPVNNGALTPAISDARIDKITAREVTIRWKTNIPTTSLIEYGLTPSYGMKTEINTMLENNHEMQLFDLQLGTKYHARAISTDPASGRVVSSADFTFETPLSETRIIDAKSVFNEPNPAHNRTTFVYRLYQPAKRMTIDVFTLSGKTIASLEAPQSTLGEGYNKVLWDLRDNNDKRVGNGVYLYKITVHLANNQVKEVKKSNLIIRR